MYISNVSLQASVIPERYFKEVNQVSEIFTILTDIITIITFNQDDYSSLLDIVAS